MRRIALTALLGTAALLACTFAPRLTGWVSPAVAAPQAVLVSSIVTPAAPLPQAEAPVVHIPEVQAPTPVAMDPSTPLLIPELDAPVAPTPQVRPPVVVVHVEPEPQPIPDPFWDDCPACGLG